MQQASGIDKEIRRIRAGLHALGERLEQERQAGTMTDAQLADLHSTMLLIRRDVSAIKDEDLPRLQRTMDKMNGRVERHGEVQHDHGTRISILEQFCDDQVRPILNVVQENRMEIAKRAALYGLIASLCAAGAAGLVQLLIHVL